MSELIVKEKKNKLALISWVLSLGYVIYPI